MASCAVYTLSEDNPNQEVQRQLCASGLRLPPESAPWLSSFYNEAAATQNCCRLPQAAEFWKHCNKCPPEDAQMYGHWPVTFSPQEIVGIPLLGGRTWANSHVMENNPGVEFHFDRNEIEKAVASCSLLEGLFESDYHFVPLHVCLNQCTIKHIECPLEISLCTGAGKVWGGAPFASCATSLGCAPRMRCFQSVLFPERCLSLHCAPMPIFEADVGHLRKRSVQRWMPISECNLNTEMSRLARAGTSTLLQVPAWNGAAIPFGTLLTHNRLVDTNVEAKDVAGLIEAVSKVTNKKTHAMDLKHGIKVVFSPFHTTWEINKELAKSTSTDHDFLRGIWFDITVYGVFLLPQVHMKPSM